MATSSRTTRRSVLLGLSSSVASLLLVSGVNTADAAPAVTTASCAPATVDVQVRAGAPLLDFAENLGFDGAGNMWVSRTLRNEVQRYDRSGRVTAAVPVDTPGAVRPGPGGSIYVNSGDNPINMLPGSNSGTVVRFDPANPRPTVFAGGLAMPNGAAFDSHGFLYVGDTGRGLTRIAPNGMVDAAWTARAPKNFDVLAGVNGGGVNGVAVIGDDVYVTLTTSVSGRILRVPIADPGRATVATDLLLDARTAIPDDLAAAADGSLYVTTTTGQLVRVDPKTRSTCTVLSTQPMTSVAFVPGSDGELVATTESGDVLRIRLGV